MDFKCKKTSYSTKQFALEHIAIIAKKSTRDQSPKSAYLCKHCNTWHITKQESIASLKELLKEKEDLLKSREEELFKLKVFVKNLDNNRNNSLGTNELQLKIRRLEKENSEIKLLKASYGKKFDEASTKLNTVKNIVYKGIKKGYKLEEFINKIKQKI
jgi:hydrogenase maturation factor HypF (carbamoyltransferase family)